MTKNLRGTGPMVVGNIFCQSSNQYLFQAAAFVRLVIIGLNNEGFWSIREKFRKG